MEQFSQYFNIVVLLLSLLLARPLGNFSQKNKVLFFLLLLIIAAPIAYSYYSEQSYAGIIYSLVLVLLVFYVKQLGLSYQSYLPLHLPVITLFYLAYANRYWQWFGSQEAGLGLINLSAACIAWLYLYQPRMGIEKPRSLKFDGLQLVSLTLFSTSVTILALQFNLSKDSLGIKNNLLEYFFVTVVTFEVVTKIGFQRAFFSQLQYSTAFVRVIASALFAGLTCYLFTGSGAFIIPAITLGLFTAIYFEALGIFAAIAFHSMIWLIAWLLWSISF